MLTFRNSFSEGVGRGLTPPPDNGTKVKDQGNAF